MTTTRIMFLLLISAMSIAFGQETGKQDRFPSMEACKAAVLSGDFQYYKPSFLNNHREVRGGEEVRQLEERACVEMKIVGGRGYVPQAKGEKFIFFGMKPVVRYDCGNDVREIVYIPVPPPPAPTPAPVPEPEPTPPPTPMPKPEAFDSDPACLILGTPETGFVGVVYNGVGVWYGDGKELAVTGTDGVKPSDSWGDHQIELVVNKGDRRAICKRSWVNIPPSQEVVITYERRRPTWSFFPVANCVYVWIVDVKHDWKNPLIDLERAACVAGPVVGAVLMSGGSASGTLTTLIKNPGWVGTTPP